MRILGIDPGYDRVGVAIIDKANKEKERLIFSTCIETNKKDPFETRVCSIGLEIKNIIKNFKPNRLAIESLFIEKNQKTAMRVSEARGIIIYESALGGLEIKEFSPLQIKIAVTGYGRSDKRQVIDMLHRLIKIETKIKHDDEYDAIAVALTGLFIREK